MDRVFRQNDHNLKEITAQERLAYLGDRCMGALSYEPELGLLDESKESIDIITLIKLRLKSLKAPSLLCLST